MSDDWSLKGKEKHEMGKLVPVVNFRERDIDVLRSKLIEDFESELNDYQKEPLMPCIKRIINKRFGVDKR